MVKNEKNITFAERDQFVLIFTFTEIRALTIYGVDQIHDPPPPPPPRNLYRYGLECGGLKGFCIKEESEREPSGVGPVGVIDQQLKVLCGEALPRDSTHYSLIFNKSYLFLAF